MERSIVRWYIARIKPRTETKIKEYLDSAGIENFRPAQMSDTIFVRAVEETVFSLLQNSSLAMDFQYNPVSHRLQTIPDKQMADFVLLQKHSEELFFLPEPEKLQGGEKVRVVGGEYSGVEGEIYRIKGHKRVVVRLGNLGAVALGGYVAKENLIKT
jgi:transcription antitermination factor NusG